jgi:hypothetical protein
MLLLLLSGDMVVHCVVGEYRNDQKQNESERELTLTLCLSEDDEVVNSADHSALGGSSYDFATQPGQFQGRASFPGPQLIVSI